MYYGNNGYNANNEYNDSNSCPFKVFGKALKENRPMMVLFYMNGCGHCEQMKPEWEKFYHNHNQDPSRLNNNGEPEIIQIENNELKKYMDDNHDNDIHIIGFPTIMEIANGQKKQYEGPRTNDGFEDFFNKVIEDMKKTNVHHKNQHKTNKKKIKIHNNNGHRQDDDIKNIIDDMFDNTVDDNGYNADNNNTYVTITGDKHNKPKTQKKKRQTKRKSKSRSKRRDKKRSNKNNNNNNNVLIGGSRKKRNHKRKTKRKKSKPRKK